MSSEHSYEIIKAFKGFVLQITPSLKREPGWMKQETDINTIKQQPICMRHL